MCFVSLTKARPAQRSGPGIVGVYKKVDTTLGVSLRWTALQGMEFLDLWREFLPLNELLAACQVIAAGQRLL